MLFKLIMENHMTLIRTTMLALSLFALAHDLGNRAEATELAKNGATSYTTRYIFHPVGITGTPGVGKVTALILLGVTQNDKGEAAFDKMAAKCHAIKVELGGKMYLDGACAMTDDDGDSVFSTFDSRELDASQPTMDCGTHTIIGGTGKYKGMTGKEPFSCAFKPAPEGVDPDSLNPYAVDVVHKTTWEIK